MWCLMDHVKHFDMLVAVSILKLIDKTLGANKGKWGGPTTDMLEDVKTLALNEMKEYISDTIHSQVWQS